MTIIVTGGAGFIGSNFIYLLLGERPDWRIVCIDALTYAANIHTLNDAIQDEYIVKAIDLLIDGIADVIAANNKEIAERIERRSIVR